MAASVTVAGAAAEADVALGADEAAELRGLDVTDVVLSIAAAATAAAAAGALTAVRLSEALIPFLRAHAVLTERSTNAESFEPKLGTSCASSGRDAASDSAEASTGGGQGTGV